MQSLILGGLTGIAFGFILQRGRFCMTTAYRDLYLVRDFSFFQAVMVAVAIQTIGIFTLSGAGILQIEAESFSWLAAIVGGFVFGFGIILAGGCASGQWYRVGEGLFGSVVALVFYAIGAAATKFGPLKPAMEALQAPQTQSEGSKTLYGLVGVSPWVTVLLFTLLVGIWVIRTLRQPKKKRFVFRKAEPEKKGFYQLVFGRGWNPLFTGAAIGVIAIVAWLTSAATGRDGGLGITTPTANWLVFLTDGDVSHLGWGTWLVLGILVGSFFAAKGAREFKWRTPEVTRLKSSVIGGLLMGFGASVAKGCNIGNGLVAMSTFSTMGWLATASIILGTWVGAYIFLVRPVKVKTAGTQPAGTVA